MISFTFMVRIFYLGYIGLQILVIFKILTSISKEERLQSWEAFFSKIALLINFSDLLRVMASHILPIEISPFFPTKLTTPLFYAKNTFLVIYWFGGVGYYVFLMRREYQRQIKLRLLGFRR